MGEDSEGKTTAERHHRTVRQNLSRGCAGCEPVLSLQSVKDLTELWMDDHNNERPHDAVNFKTPAENEAS